MTKTIWRRLRASALGLVACTIACGALAGQQKPEAVKPESASTKPEAAPTAKPENSFVLKLHDKEIGNASWTQTVGAGGAIQIDSHAKFKLANVAEYTLDSAAAYDAQLRFTGASSKTMVNGNPQPEVKIVVDASGKRVTFRLSMGADSVDSRRAELRPHTVMLNDFDPSGIATLLHMYKGETSLMQFEALLVKGGGGAGLGSLMYVDDAKGKLKGQAVALKHFLLSVGGVAMDAWSDSDYRLMRAAANVPGVEYVRDDFVLESNIPAGVAETEVKFHSKDLELPGTITAPATTPIAVVVMVQQSGPQDRDETMGANKPFRDLAWGLAQHGIASFRYEKRSKIAPRSLAQSPTLDLEVNDDAVAAIGFIHDKPELKELPIFVLGHALGASMAPFIVEKAKAAGSPVAGEILMAGVARPADEVLLEQIKTNTPVKQRAIALQEQKRAFANIRDPKTGNGESALGIPVGYWRDWLAHDTPAEIKKVNVPTLVLQGGEDFQTSVKDYDILKATGDPAHTTARLFPGLNHLFMPSTKTGIADYVAPSHVSNEVVVTIADWIAANAPKAKAAAAPQENSPPTPAPKLLF